MDDFFDKFFDPENPDHLRVWLEALSRDVQRKHNPIRRSTGLFSRRPLLKSAGEIWHIFLIYTGADKRNLKSSVDWEAIFLSASRNTETHEDDKFIGAIREYILSPDRSRFFIPFGVQRIREIYTNPHFTLEAGNPTRLELLFILHHRNLIETVDELIRFFDDMSKMPSESADKMLDEFVDHHTHRITQAIQKNPDQVDSIIYDDLNIQNLLIVNRESSFQYPQEILDRLFKRLKRNLES